MQIIRLMKLIKAHTHITTTHKGIAVLKNVIPVEINFELKEVK